MFRKILIVDVIYVILMNIAIDSPVSLSNEAWNYLLYTS